MSATIRPMSKSLHNPLSRLPFMTAVISLLVFAALLGTAGCEGGRGTPEKKPTDTAFVKQHCAEDKKMPCRENCKDEGKFGYCYKDKNRDTKAVDINWHCYGIHLGKTCKPCENVYTINFAGAMNTVTCEEFYAYIGDKNKRCGNCLIRQDHL